MKSWSSFCGFIVISGERFFCPCTATVAAVWENLCDKGRSRLRGTPRDNLRVTLAKDCASGQTIVRRCFPVRGRGFEKPQIFLCNIFQTKARSVNTPSTWDQFTLNTVPGWTTLRKTADVTKPAQAPHRVNWTGGYSKFRSCTKEFSVVDVAFVRSLRCEWCHALELSWLKVVAAFPILGWISSCIFLFRWDISVICPRTVLKLTATVFALAYLFGHYDRIYLFFFLFFPKIFGLWPKKYTQISFSKEQSSNMEEPR